MGTLLLSLSGGLTSSGGGSSSKSAALVSGKSSGLDLSLGSEGGRLDSVLGEAQVVLDEVDTGLLDHIVEVSPVVDLGGESLGSQRLQDLVDLDVLNLGGLVLGGPVLS